MNIGVFSRTYETGDLEQTYRKMIGHGISHTQFNFSNAGLPTLPEKISDTDIERILKTNNKYGITIDALTGTFNMIDPDKDARKRSCKQFRLQCEAARALSIPIVSLCTGSKSPRGKWTWDDENLKDSSWDDLLRTADEILTYADDNGIILGVETEASNIINTPLRARRFLDEFKTPYLKIIMDGANLFRPNQVPDMDKILIEAFDILGEDIVTAHAKDFTMDRTMSFVAAGEGILDFTLYLDLLKSHGYEGALTMHGLSEQQVPRSKTFLEECMKWKEQS